MEEPLLCNICGEVATDTFGESQALGLCNNVVCYQATLDMIKHALLEAAQGEV